MRSIKYKALVVRETAAGKFTRSIEQKDVNDLPGGELLIHVRYSSLNYKDALSATGHKGVTSSYPHTPGVDAAGIVVDSSSPAFEQGDEVLVTGFDLGQNTSGGFQQYIRVPAAWAVLLPEGLSMRESMIWGTAGFTAGMALRQMETFGLTPARGEVLVTGATGGMGCLAVALLAKAGYRVVAATGKPDQVNFLKEIGAAEIIDRHDPLIDDPKNKPMLSARWAGVIDTVGGNILATAVKSTKHEGCVAVCGLVASNELNVTVYPFVIRGVKLIGIESATYPMSERRKIWHKLAGPWRIEHLSGLAQEIPLSGLDSKIEEILAGKIRGRTLINLEL